MRIGFLLTISLLGVALLVAVLGGLLEGTSTAVVRELDDLRRSSIEEMLGADEMLQAMLSTEAAAYRLLAERYRQRPGDASHEEEWGSVPQLDLDAIDDGLELFEDALARCRRALTLSTDIGSTRPAGAGGSGLAARTHQLLEIEREFAVHEQLHDRLEHLMRYHPTDQVREFLLEQLEPHYQDRLRPLIRRFSDAARADLASEAAAVEKLVHSATLRNRWLTGFAFVMAVLLGLVLSRAISRPLGKLREAALRVGEGNLDQHVDVPGDTEFGVLARAFNDMAANLRTTTVSRAHLDNILQSMTEMVLVFDAHGRVRTANAVAERELDGSDADIEGREFAQIVRDPEAALENGSGEAEVMRGDGSSFPASLSRSELKGPGGEPDGFVLVARNIEERRRAEETLRDSLRDKDLLLKEIHHRVKNNLQIISSLLRLQESDVSSPAKGLRDSQNRIRSMALIHEHLYRSADLANIDFRAYLEELITNLAASYGDRARAVRTEFEIASEPLNLDTAIPCGMIVNELVANALEHGQQDSGKVEVSFRAEGDTRVLEVRNDGGDLPTDFDIDTTGSLGLRLVSALTQQIGGALDFDSEGGATRFAVRFSLPREDAA